jgi:hypothetical protein
VLKIGRDTAVAGQELLEQKVGSAQNLFKYRSGKRFYTASVARGGVNDARLVAADDAGCSGFRRLERDGRTMDSSEVATRGDRKNYREAG